MRCVLPSIGLSFIDCSILTRTEMTAGFTLATRSATSVGATAWESLCGLVAQALALQASGMTRVSALAGHDPSRSGAVVVSRPFRWYSTSRCRRGVGRAMTSVADNRLCFVLVPGIDPGRFIGWAPSYKPNLWFQDDHQISKDLSKSFPGARIIRFEWSRTNTQRARSQAAEKLVSLIAELRREFSRIVIIAHSHGGNVAVQATQRTPGDDLLLVTLATPFIEVRAEKSVQRIGVLFVLLYSLPLLAAAFSFPYFFATGQVDRAAHSAMLVLLLAVGFYFLIVKYKIQEVIRSRLMRLELQIRKSCEGLSYHYPIRTLVIYYLSDEWLLRTARAQKRDSALSKQLEGGMSRMDFLFALWNPLYLAIFVTMSLILIFYELLILKSAIFGYLLAASLTIVAAYYAIGLLLIITPSVKILAGAASKFKIFGMSSFSPLENLLVSVRTRVLPVLANRNLSTTIATRTVNEVDDLHHSYVTVDPEIADLIIRWVRHPSPEAVGPASPAA